MRLNLGCSDQSIEGFIGVDTVTPSWATPENFLRADLRHSWPWADSSVDHIRMWDCIEHLPDKIHSMNELYRVLKPSGTVEIIVPTTDGRGAWQDPTHVSFWNRNSFFYFECGNPHLTRFREGNGVKCEFRIKAENTETLADSVVKLAILLEAVKLTNDQQLTVPVQDQQLIQGQQVKRPRFSIIHPSARPDEWQKVARAWIESAVYPGEVEYVLVWDHKFFGEPPTPEIFQQLGLDRWTIAKSDDPANYVANVNKGAKLSFGEILIVVADDQYPCEKWDEKLWEVARFAPTDIFVISVSTGTPKEHEREIVVMPVLARGRYEKYGYVFYPRYESMYADNDFYALAARDQIVDDARGLMFPHRHWLNGQREKDAADELQNRSEAHQLGQALFEFRKANDFPDDVQINYAPTRKTIVACTPGDMFSMAWVNSWTQLALHIAGKHNLHHLMAYSSDVAITRHEMLKAILGIKAHVDYVLWLDDDNILSSEQLEMMIRDLEAHPELDSVSAWCWCGPDEQPANGVAAIPSCGNVSNVELTPDGDLKYCHGIPLNPQKMKDAPSDLIEIGYSGFPAVLMRRDLLVKAGKFPFTPVIDDRCQWGKSGEDLAFFAKAAVRGSAKFAVDRRIEIPHFKRRAMVPTINPFEDVSVALAMS